MRQRRLMRINLACLAVVLLLAVACGRHSPARSNPRPTALGLPPRRRSRLAITRSSRLLAIPADRASGSGTTTARQTRSSARARAAQSLRGMSSAVRRITTRRHEGAAPWARPAWCGWESTQRSSNSIRKTHAVQSWTIPTPRDNPDAEKKLPPARSGVPSLQGIHAVQALAVGPDGHVAIAMSHSSSITRFDPGTAAFTSLALPATSDEPISVAFSRDGTVAVGFTAWSFPGTPRRTLRPSPLSHRRSPRRRGRLAAEPARHGDDRSTRLDLSGAGH